MVFVVRVGSGRFLLLFFRAVPNKTSVPWIDVSIIYLIPFRFYFDFWELAGIDFDEIRSIGGKLPQCGLRRQSFFPRISLSAVRGSVDGTFLFTDGRLFNETFIT